MLNQNWVQLTREYDEAARAYCDALTLENHMEAFSQAQQRKITVASFDQIAEDMPDLHHFNELLIQDLSLKPKIQVCPDNMVVLHRGNITVDGHYGIQLQPVRPYWVLEYASKGNARKDYERNIDYYERLQIPYYLIYSPEAKELLLYHLVAGKYRFVAPDDNGLAHLPEMNVGVKVLNGWVRYWWRGQLIPLTGDLVRSVRAKDAALLETKQLLTQKDDALAQKDQLLTQKDNALAQKDQLLAQKDAALAALMAELARLRGQPSA